MGQLDPDGRVDDVLVPPPADLARQQGEQRAEALAPGSHEVPRRLGDEGVVVVDDLLQPTRDRRHAVGHAGLQRLVDPRERGDAHRTKAAALWARSRTGAGITPRARVTTTPTTIAKVVIQDGSATAVSPASSPSHMATTSLK